MFKVPPVVSIVVAPIDLVAVSVKAPVARVPILVTEPILVVSKFEPKVKL